MSKRREKKTPKGDYDVGYCRTPTHTRYQPGQSGNGKGRPKGSTNLKKDLEEELNETIEFTERGERRTTSKRRAILKQLAAKAMKGDVRAATLLLKYAQDADQSPPTDEDDDPVSDKQAQRLDDFVRREAKRLRDEEL